MPPSTRHPLSGRGAQRLRLVLSTTYPLGHQRLPQTLPGCTHRRRIATHLDIEVKYGASLNYSVGERGSQDGVLLFSSVINSL